MRSLCDAKCEYRISLDDVRVAFNGWASHPFVMGDDVPDELREATAKEARCDESDILAVYGNRPSGNTPFFAILAHGLLLRPEMSAAGGLFTVTWDMFDHMWFDDRNTDVPSCLHVYGKGDHYCVLDLQFLSTDDMELVYNAFRWLDEAAESGSTFWSKGWRRCVKMEERLDEQAYAYPESQPHQLWEVWK